MSGQNLNMNLNVSDHKRAVNNAGKTGRATARVGKRPSDALMLQHRPKYPSPLSSISVTYPAPQSKQSQPIHNQTVSQQLIPPTNRAPPSSLATHALNTASSNFLSPQIGPKTKQIRITKKIGFHRLRHVLRPIVRPERYTGEATERNQEIQERNLARALFGDGCTETEYARGVLVYESASEHVVEVETLWSRIKEVPLKNGEMNVEGSEIEDKVLYSEQDEIRYGVSRSRKMKEISVLPSVRKNDEIIDKTHDRGREDQCYGIINPRLLGRRN